MRKLSLLSVGTLGATALALALGHRVHAGDYHVRSTLNCGDCHVMHPGEPRPVPRPTANVGRRDDGAREDETRVGPLLRKDANDLCLSCHDGSLRAPDVLGNNQGSGASSVRQAGHLNRLGISGHPSTGHTLGSTEVAPGSDPPWHASLESPGGTGLTCLSCHRAHGRAAAYRNLRDDAGNNLPGEGLVTYNRSSPGSNDPSRDVFVRRTRDYDESAVDFNEPDPRDSAMARFCAGCHGSFHGSPGSKEIGGIDPQLGHLAFRRHPSAAVDVGAIGGELSSLERFAGHANRVKVLSATGSWDTPGVDTTPTCISCHKAHGNGNPFGLIFRSGQGALTEDGDTQGKGLPDLCGQCHVQAASFAQP